MGQGGVKWGRVGFTSPVGFMSGFLGSYVHQVDDKGRLSLPASYRRAAAEGPLFVAQVNEDALTVYPETTWHEMESRLLEMRRRQPEMRRYVLGITSNTVEVVPDKQGRILLPARLLQAVGIGDSAMLVGAIDRIEVWNPERFAQVTAELTPEAERFASQVFA